MTASKRSIDLFKLIISNTYLIFPFFTISVFSLLIIETFSYSGFVSHYFVLDAKFYMFLNLLLGILLIFSRSFLKNHELKVSYSITKLIFQLNYLLSPVLIIIYYIIITAEASNYPNYVYSKIHINPDNLVYVLFFSIFIVFIGLVVEGKLFKLLNLTKKKRFTNPNIENIYIIFVLILLIFSLDNFIRTFRETLKSNIYIITQIDADYDKKMTESWHFFYKYMKFVKDVTPEDSAIAIPPPERPWLSEGNSVLVRYFLYPRYLVTIEDETGKNIKPDYYLLTKGIWKAYSDEDYGWPKESIHSSDIFYFDEKTNSYNVVNGTYDPSDPKNKYSFGLIKVK